MPEPALRRDPSAERHDGAMLRGTFGFGGISDVFNNDVGPDAHSRLSGGGVSLSFDVGGAVAQSTVVHARLSSLWATDPHSRIDGTNYDQSRHDYTAAVLLAPAITSCGTSRAARYRLLPMVRFVLGCSLGATLRRMSLTRLRLGGRE